MPGLRRILMKILKVMFFTVTKLAETVLPGNCTAKENKIKLLAQLYSEGPIQLSS